MATQVQCPKCQKAGSVPDTFLGKAVVCATCKAKFTADASVSPAHAAGTVEGSTAATLDKVAPVKTDAAVLPPTETQPAIVPGGSHLPEKIGRFQVRSRLGGGAFGSVYRAYDPQLEREVALKVPHPDTLANPRSMQRFLDEAKAAARLHHLHIVPIHEVGQDGNIPFIVSSFIEGRTLADAIDEGLLDCRQSARLVAEVADALAYAHGQGIVHRDVKPANILLGKSQASEGAESPGEWVAYLTDFGLAHRAYAGARLTQEGAVLGTPHYMAPERADGQQGEPLPASDQYGLGVVLYELLCGQTPFSGPPGLVLYLAVHTEPVPPQHVKPNIPPHLEQICLKAMAKRVADRYASLVDLAAALRHFLQREGASPAARAALSTIRPPANQTTAAGQTPPAVAATAQAGQARSVLETQSLASSSNQGKRIIRRWRISTAITAGVLALASLVVFWNGPGARNGVDRQEVGARQKSPLQTSSLPITKLGPSTQGESTEASTGGKQAPANGAGLANRRVSQAWKLVEQGDYDQAIEQCTAALQMDPDQAEAHYCRAYAHYHKPKPDFVQAIVDCSEAMRIRPDYLAALVLRGLVYCNLRDFAKAIADSKAAIGMNPDYADAYSVRAMAYRERGAANDYDAALADCNQAIRINSKQSSYFTIRGTVYAYQGNFDQATTDLNQALAIDQKNGEAWASLGYVWLKKNQYDQAIASYSKAFDLGEQSAVYYVNRGQAFSKKGETDHAIRDYTMAIQLDPNCVAAYEARGLAYLGKNNDVLAEADQAKAKELKHKQSGK